MSKKNKQGRGSSHLKAVINKDKLRDKCNALGKEIKESYGDDPFTMIWIGHGAWIFSSDLIRQIKSDWIRVGSLRAKSYEQTESSGRVDITADRIETRSIEGQRVLLVDDILDTGRTLSEVSAYIRELGARELRTCVLLDKPSRRQIPIEADFVGFKIENVFVVGYGLDYRDRFRQLRYIAELDARSRQRVDEELDGPPAIIPIGVGAPVKTDPSHTSLGVVESGPAAREASV